MAMIGIKVPSSMEDSLSKLNVSGKKVPKDSYHITMFYIEKKLNVKDVCEILTVIHNASKGISPFRVKGTKISSFPKGPDGVPVIIPIESKELFEFREKLSKKLDSAKIDYSKRFPEYKPHVTLSYSSKEEDKKLDKAISWKVLEIIVWAGEEMDDFVIVRIPLSIHKKASSDFCELMSDAFLQMSE